MSVVTSARLALARGISDMRPVPKTDRIRRFVVTRLGIRYQSVPSGVTPYVVLATERSGSSLLMDLLSSWWSSVRSDGEIFNSHIRRERRLDEVLAATYCTDTGHRFVGSKIIRKQISESEVNALLAIPGMRAVVLRRENVIRQYVSLMIAANDGIWRQPAHSPRSGASARSVHIDLDKLIAYENRQNRMYEEFENFVDGMPIHRVTYESMMDDLDTEIGKVGEFLGAGPPDRRVVPRLRHQNPEPLTDLISNLEQLRQDLIGFGHSHLAGQLDA